MTKTKWCVIQKTKTKSEFAVKINTAGRVALGVSRCNIRGLCRTLKFCEDQSLRKNPKKTYTNPPHGAEREVL